MGFTKRKGLRGAQLVDRAAETGFPE